MKTLADLKRDAASGKLSLELIERFGQSGDDIKSTMRGIRKVSPLFTSSKFLTCMTLSPSR